jgi:copper homeostasis protein CutC
VKKKILLEISVEFVNAAAAAARGGADRIELCSNLSVGGLTPKVTFLRALRQQIQIPIFVTSGGAASAPEGAAKLEALVAAAGERITIVPGAGINAGNILQLAAATRAHEFHSGLSTVLSHQQTDYVKFENEVRAMVDALDPPH